MMKVILPDEELKMQCKQLVREIEHWKTINEYGCNDPFWPDGTNMNLTRNHIIYHKMSIRQICGENCLSLPDEYYIPTPPEVPEEYMAGLDQKERTERLIKSGYKLNTSRKKYDDIQLKLF